MNKCKMLVSSLVAVSIVSLSLVSAAQAEPPLRVTVPVKHVYVPKGFDDNDGVEIVITGYLPSLCFYAPAATASLKDGKINVDVTAYQSRATNCEMMIVPFMLTVPVGVIPSGTFPIAVNGGTTAQTLTSLHVSRAFSATVDDHIYASVDSIDRVQGTRTVKLRGYNPSDCYELDAVQVGSNNKDTFSILPVMKKTRTSCPMKMVPFEYSVQIPTTLAQDEVLIHVRSLKGASANYLFLQEEGMY